MAEIYQGWTLFDKVIICARPYERYNWSARCTEALGKQAYVVDPSNKSMLQSARRWAKWTEHGPYDVQTRQYEYVIQHEAEETTFDNEGFQLELFEAAQKSSQGGKLSFWNCRITKDGQSWIIGIAANLLLDVLKHTTVINGKVQEPLFFARCKGGVGMLSKNMPAYERAVADMTRKEDMSKGKTAKHRLGYLYETTTEKSFYAGDLWSWYEPVRAKIGYFTKVTGFRRRSKPVILKCFPSYYADRSLEYHQEHFGLWQCRAKLPARKQGQYIGALDMNAIVAAQQADIVKSACDFQAAKNRGLTMSNFITDAAVGLSASGESYEMPEAVRQAIQTLGYTIYDECK